jgi:hypothetical protein
MPNFIKKFWRFLNQPDPSDVERIERWREEMNEADRLALLGGTEPELKSIPRRKSKKEK